MHKFYLPLIALLFAFTLSSCLSYKEYPVEYDYSFRGDFQNYTTYGFMNSSDNSPIAGEVVKKSIMHYMDLLGYTYSEEEPSFLINFLYMPDSLSYKGYEQPELFQFIKFKKEKEKQRAKYETKMLNIHSGTLVITFIEKKNYSTIWQGYTTDLYNEDIKNDPVKARLAVLSILKNYVYLPDLN